MKKTRKKLLAVLLAFTMLFGSSMTVFAVDYNWDDIKVGDELQNGDTISVTYATITSHRLTNANHNSTGEVSLILCNNHTFCC